MPRARRLVLLWALGLIAVATVVGVVLLWPNGDEVNDVQDSVTFSAPGVTFPNATVDEAEPACPDVAPADDCGAVEATISDGDDEGTEVRVAVPPEVSESGLEKGDTIRLISTPETDETPQAYNYFGTGRSGTLWLLAILFVVVVLLVARLRGLFALIGLGFTAVVAWTFMLPALLVGETPLLVALVGCSAIMFVVLYTTHGLSIRTSAALAGTLLGIALTAGLGAIFVGASRLTGVADESGNALRSYVGDLSFTGLLTCAVVIAGLGVLNDVTITQASSVWELRSAAPAARAPPPLHQRHADRPRPHRLRDLHDPLRVRRHRTAGAARAAALRTSDGGAALHRGDLAGGRALAGHQPGAGAGGADHHGDRRDHRARRQADCRSAELTRLAARTLRPRERLSDLHPLPGDLALRHQRGVVHMAALGDDETEVLGRSGHA